MQIRGTPNRSIPEKLVLQPWGLAAWKVFRGGHQLGIIRRLPHECHCKDFGKWKFQCYDMKGQQINLKQFNLANAKKVFEKYKG